MGIWLLFLKKVYCVFLILVLGLRIGRVEVVWRDWGIVMWERWMDGRIGLDC